MNKEILKLKLPGPDARVLYLVNLSH